MIKFVAKEIPESLKSIERRFIIALLIKYNPRYTVIQRHVKIKFSSLDYHLWNLEDAGLITKFEKDGWDYYCLTQLGEKIVDQMSLKVFFDIQLDNWPTIHW